METPPCRDCVLSPIQVISNVAAKDRSIRSRWRTAWYSFQGCRRLNPARAKLNACPSSARPRLSSRKCASVLKPLPHRSRMCSSAMSTVRLSLHTSPFSTTSTRAISRTSLQPASSFTYPLLQALSTSKSIASPQSSCCLMHLWPLLAESGNSSSRIIGRGATLFARLTTRPPPPTEHPHNELSGDQLRQKVQIVRRTVAAKSHSRNERVPIQNREATGGLHLA